MPGDPKNKKKSSLPTPAEKKKSFKEGFPNDDIPDQQALDSLNKEDKIVNQQEQDKILNNAPREE